MEGKHICTDPIITRAKRDDYISDADWIELAGILVIESTWLNTVEIISREESMISFRHATKGHGGNNESSFILHVMFEGNSIEFHYHLEGSPKNVVTPRSTNIFWEKLKSMVITNHKGIKDSFMEFVGSGRACDPDSYVFPSNSFLKYAETLGISWDDIVKG